MTLNVNTISFYAVTCCTLGHDHCLVVILASVAICLSENYSANIQTPNCCIYTGGYGQIRCTLADRTDLEASGPH